jgi:hypothetical protein
MEKRGLLERKSDPLDGRKALFALTDSGRALDVPATGTVEAAVQRALARLPRARLVAAQEVLATLAEELGSGDAPLDNPTGVASSRDDEELPMPKNGEDADAHKSATR